MKAVVYVERGTLAVREVETPRPESGQVRIRTAACGICATDLEMIAGAARVRCPAVLGHEWSGVVDAVGPGGDQSLIGRSAVAENVLARGGEVGFEHGGGYGEYLLTDAANVHPLPDGFPLEVAALIEPLAVGVHALRRLGTLDVRRVLVLGDGPIGLVMVMLLAHAGIPEVCVVGGEPRRLALARELDATATLDHHAFAGDHGRILREWGEFPIIVEASGAPSSAAAAFDAAACGARVLLLGDYADHRADVRWNRVLHRELTIIGSNASAGAWAEAVRLAVSLEIPLARLLTHRITVDEVLTGIDLVRTRQAVKVVMDWRAARSA